MGILTTHRRAILGYASKHLAPTQECEEETVDAMGFGQCPMALRSLPGSPPLSARGQEGREEEEAGQVAEDAGLLAPDTRAASCRAATAAAAPAIDRTASL